ncbi:DUF5916 domain-containing protein [bacterium]|nr:DUF5916 domain-containing protein [bacterium]
MVDGLTFNMSNYNILVLDQSLSNNSYLTLTNTNVQALAITVQLKPADIKAALVLDAFGFESLNLIMSSFKMDFTLKK